MTMTAQSSSPFSAYGAKLSEVEVWSAEPTPRNVALRSAGGKAEGEKSTTARDFPEAYSAWLCIDGDTGAQWFIGRPSVLTLTFAQTETIDRLVFRNAKGTVKDDPTRGSTPCEYFIETSVDGVSWRRRGRFRRPRAVHSRPRERPLPPRSHDAPRRPRLSTR